MTRGNPVDYPDWPPHAGWDAAADSPAQPRLPQADWPNRATSRFVDAAGLRWHVQRAGSGPTLLLLHGTGSATHSWRDLLPMLAASFDVIAPDLPGHGYTGSPGRRRMTLPAIASDLRQLLDTLHASPSIVVGHSAGTAVLVRMALDRAIDPACIIGINAALLPLNGPSRAFFAPLARLLAATGIAPWLVARQARDPAAVRRMIASTGSAIDARGEALYRQLMRDACHVAAVLEMMAGWNLHNLPAELSALTPHLHLIVADGDKAVAPGEAGLLQSYLPSLTIGRVHGAGHLAHEELPDIVARQVIDASQNHGLIHDGD